MKEFSLMAQGYNGKAPIKCYLYLTDANMDLESVQKPCYLDTIGCITILTIISNGWTSSPPPFPIQDHICLAEQKRITVNIGECNCNDRKICSCYCIGTLCNSRLVFLNFFYNLTSDKELPGNPNFY